MRIITAILILSVSVANAQDAAFPPLETLPEHLVYAPVPEPSAEAKELQQLYARNRRWEAGQTLKICFFGGNLQVRKVIVAAATLWTASANLKFDFGSADHFYDCLAPSTGFSQIRIGFRERGYWSLVGRDSQTELGPNQPSMNLEQYDGRLRRERYPTEAAYDQFLKEARATILHEFGHAIGLLHEHQNPSLRCTEEIRWSGPGNVYDYLHLSPNFWTREMVDRNLGSIQNTDPDYAEGEADPESIMMYHLDPKIFKTGVNSPCFVPQQFRLSDKDKQIVAKIYPAGAPQISDALIVSGAFKPLPASAPAAELVDYRERILADLGSDVTSTRRDARIRLANYLESASLEEVNSLVQAMPAGSYRYQLGMAVALSHTKNVSISLPSQKALEGLKVSAGDATLRNALNSVRLPLSGR